MRLPRLLGVGFVLRRIVRELSGVREQLTRQNDLLARMADTFAPADPITNPKEVAQLTGVDYLDATEAGIVLDFVERTRRETGHEPDGEEILTYLADEKTVDLHQRLRAREAEIAQLTADRAARRETTR